MKTAFNEVKLVLRGFDVVIKPSEEDSCYNVVIYENTKQVAQYDVNVDFDKFEGTDEDLDGSDDIYEYVGEAAIDLYESSRNTLGQGAGAMDKKSIRKSACYLTSIGREEWFLGLKGTPYEQQALELLTSYIESLYHRKDKDTISQQIEMLTKKEDEAFYQLEKIYIEYMKELDPHQTVIVIQATRKIGFYGTGEVQELLDKFEGTKWESQVIDLIRIILDCRTQVENLYQTQDDSWGEQQQQLNSAMDELSLVALEDKLNGKAVINQMPEMLEDLVELAAGVDFSEPLEPMGGSILSTKARKRAYQDNEPEEKENFGLSMVVDAEEEADIKFTVNQEVSLNKKIEVPLWGGAVEELASGTKGVIETAYDDVGNDYLFRSEDGITVRVNKDDLKKR